MRKTSEMVQGTHKRTVVVPVDTQLVYTLWYTNECGSDIEHEFEVPNNEAAIGYAMGYCKGNEGLWSGIYLTNCEGKDLDFSPF